MANPVLAFPHGAPQMSMRKRDWTGSSVTSICIWIFLIGIYISIFVDIFYWVNSHFDRFFRVTPPTPTPRLPIVRKIKCFCHFFILLDGVCHLIISHPMMQGLPPNVFLTIGLMIIGRAVDCAVGTEHRQFQATFGLSARICSLLWFQIRQRRGSIPEAKPKHLMWDSMFLKMYQNEHVCHLWWSPLIRKCQENGCGEKLLCFLQNMWVFIALMYWLWNVSNKRILR